MEEPTTPAPNPLPPSTPASGSGAGAGDRVQSTATGELMQRLATAPKLDEQRFVLQGELGKGGMGLVMQIHDRFLNRRLAMKLLLERRAPRDEQEERLAHQLLGRFLEEAQVTSQLDHPGVVPVHELGLDQAGKVYFTMRMVKGRTASEVFADAHAERNGWSLSRALEIVLKVCDTMNYAHEKGVLHRDLKPANVMVGRFGEVYVMDWGLAKVLGQPDRHDLRIRSDASTGASRLETARKQDAELGVADSVVTMDGQQLGTPSYMSPEQARSEDADQRADVYAVGAMLYELVTGSAPYVPHGMRKAAYKILEEVLVGPPRAVSDLRKDVPRDLRCVIDRAMARDRSERYATMAELAMALRAAIAKPFRMWVRRNKLLAASVVTLAVVLLSGVALLWMAWMQAEEARAEAVVLARSEAVLRSAERAAMERALASERAAVEQKRISEAMARDKAALAESEGVARAEAQRTVFSFKQLAAVVRLNSVLEQQEQLWPAWPDKVKALEAWLAGPCQELLDQQPEIEATVAALRAKAVPRTAEQVEADRRASPQHAAFDRQRQLVVSLRRAQRIRVGEEPFLGPELPPALRDADASTLNAFAWLRVAPESPEDVASQRMKFGEEAMALVAARAAVAKAAGTPAAAGLFDTLAWAALANGQDGEASQAAAAALAQAPVAERSVYEVYLREVTAAIAEAPTRLAAAESKLEELDAAVSMDRTWTFRADPDGESARFLHDALVGTLSGLDALAKNQRLDVAQRLAWAQQVAVASADHPQARVTWAAARAAIAKADGLVANSMYAGRSIVIPDGGWVGLVPIGMNPVTKLWEFYDLRSAWDGKQVASEIAIPTHRADGSIQVQAGTGIVFVLLPGGTVRLGSQKEDPNAPFYDPQRNDDESLHDVTLSPFLLARYELTQAQWSRLWTWGADLTNPSQYRAGQSIGGQRISGLNPVEQVDWFMCDRLLTRHGMDLPTEAQWEYACRGATTTAWQVSLDALRSVANVADAAAKRSGASWICESWSDGFSVHAPVGRFAANGFGLHDMHGNVWEWCRDGYGNGAFGIERDGDGLRLVAAPVSRIQRGGSFVDPSTSARAASRGNFAPSYRSPSTGLRPARRITF